METNESISICDVKDVLGLVVNYCNVLAIAKCVQPLLRGLLGCS